MQRITDQPLCGLQQLRITDFVVLQEKSARAQQEQRAATTGGKANTNVLGDQSLQEAALSAAGEELTVAGGSPIQQCGRTHARWA